MLGISARKHADFAGRFLGTERKVLLEHSRPGHPLGGFTDNYLRVATTLGPEYDNRIITLSLDSLQDDGETVNASLKE